MATQTPAQKRANAKFAREQESKMGTYRAPKPEKDERRKQALSQRFGTKSGSAGQRVGRGMVYVLLFLLVGGLLFELLRLFL